MKFNNNYTVGKNVTIGKNVRIGDRTIIYDNVSIGDNTIICNDCIIGEPQNDYYFSKNYENPVTKIGVDSLIRSHTLIYSGCRFGKKFSTGHRVTIREEAVFGDYCRVGTLSDIQGYVSFGNYCWLHSNVHIGQKSSVGNYVFIYPFVVLTNDPHPPSNDIAGPRIGDYTQIAVHTTILPGVKIGSHVLIGANSLVTKDVNDFSLTAGNPAKHIKDVKDVISKEAQKPLYPWPQRFERGMPWEGIGYDEWLKQQQ